jgi:hypothetical protein
MPTLWSLARIASAVASGVREQFSELATVELTLDVMRRASNELAVSLAADAPRWTERTSSTPTGR